MSNKDPVIRKAYSRQWYLNNKKAADNNSNVWRQKKRLRLIEDFGGACAHCGEKDQVVLVFDHINDDGHIDRKIYKSHIVHLVAKEPQRFQILCRNCNWRKEYWRQQNAKHK